MRQIKLTLALAMISSASAQAVPTPFGLIPGTSIQDLTKIGIFTTPTAGVYILKSVPIPNSAFESYSVVASKTYGLCKVTAWGKNQDNDSKGELLISMFNSLKEILIKKYGKSEDYDFIDINSIWKSSIDWMMSLKMKDRTLTSYWIKSTNSNLKSPINSIMLEANGLSSSTGYVILGYQFDNFKDCASEIKEDSGTGL